MYRQIMRATVCLLFAGGLGAVPAGADQPAVRVSQLECAEYYVLAEFPLADGPAATEYSDLLVGLNWGSKIIFAAPKADAAAAGQPVIQFMRQNSPRTAKPFGAPQDYPSMVQPLIDHYDPPCRTYSGLAPLDLKALQAAIEARLKAKGIAVQ